MLWGREAKLNTRINQPCLNICHVLEGSVQSLSVLKILWYGWVTSVSMFPPSNQCLWSTWWRDETSKPVDPHFGAHTVSDGPAGPRGQTRWHHTEVLPHIQTCNLFWVKLFLTSLSNWSSCSSSMPSSRLIWWNFLVMLRWRSRSWRVSEFSMRPSTRWLWKAWEYWGRPTSLNQALATQWWSRSAALDNLQMKKQSLIDQWRHF